MSTTEPITFRAGPEGIPKMGGPARCPKPCSECAENPGSHHFSEMMMGFAHEEPEHEAAVAGCEDWLCCKHCEGWLEYTSYSDHLRLYRWQPSLGTVERSDELDVWERIGAAASLEEAHNVATVDATNDDDEFDCEPDGNTCIECEESAGQDHLENCSRGLAEAKARGDIGDG